MLRSSFFPCPLPPLYIKVLSFVGIFLCWRVRRDVRGHRNFKDSTISVGRNSMSIKVIWEPVGRLQFLRSLHKRIHIMNYLSYRQPAKVFSPWRLLYGSALPLFWCMSYVYLYDLTDAFSLYKDPYHGMSQMENSARWKCRLYLCLTLRWRGHTCCTHPAAELPS